MTGQIGDTWIAGSVTGKSAAARPDALRDYPAIATTLHEVMAAKMFRPADLDTPGYETFKAAFAKIAAAARDDMDFWVGFQAAWQNDPFSHFVLRRSAQPAQAMLAYFDTFRVGRKMAEVAYDGDIAILTVRTMMGLDTIEHIEAAFDEIAKAGSKALIIDLRGNGGGALR